MCYFVVLRSLEEPATLPCVRRAYGNVELEQLSPRDYCMRLTSCLGAWVAFGPTRGTACRHPRSKVLGTWMILVCGSCGNLSDSWIPCTVHASAAKLMLPSISHHLGPLLRVLQYYDTPSAVPATLAHVLYSTYPCNIDIDNGSRRSLILSNAPLSVYLRKCSIANY